MLMMINFVLSVCGRRISNAHFHLDRNSLEQNSFSSPFDRTRTKKNANQQERREREREREKRWWQLLAVLFFYEHWQAEQKKEKQEKRRRKKCSRSSVLHLGCGIISNQTRGARRRRRCRREWRCRRRRRWRQRRRKKEWRKNQEKTTRETVDEVGTARNFVLSLVRSVGRREQKTITQRREQILLFFSSDKPWPISRQDLTWSVLSFNKTLLGRENWK